MVGTAMDYARFLTMLHGNGRSGSTRLLGRKMLEMMTSDHLGNDIAVQADLLPPGHGFGLGFAVRTQPGLAPFPGSVGNYFWSGAAGTFFWVDPVERLYAVFMCQAPGQRDYTGSCSRPGLCSGDRLRPVQVDPILPFSCSRVRSLEVAAHRRVDLRRSHSKRTIPITRLAESEHLSYERPPLPGDDG